MPSTITVYCNELTRAESARQYAADNDFAFSDSLPVSTDFYLDFNQLPAILHDTNSNNQLSIDFTRGAIAHRLQYGGGKGQSLAKAIGITSKNKPHILDATAGLGRDAIILANLGTKLTLVEQSPVLAMLLAQAIEAAQEDDLFTQATEHGFDLYQANAASFMDEKTIPECDVVYLDPMYPEKMKSALVKKDMQMLQALIGHSSDETNAVLLKSALQFAKQRVVVKRPKGAPELEGIKPTMALQSKKTRYDVYVMKAIKT